MRGFQKRDRNENVFVLPDGLGGNAETTISCEKPGPARKKVKVYQ